jgi:AcrR family transcriptional regulator
MGKAFSEQELINIRTELIASGRRFAQEYGFKKTSVDEIIQDVGVSKGIFYKFFSSKEDFFFKVREEVEKEIQEMIRQIFSTESNNNKEMLVDKFCKVLMVIKDPKYIRFFEMDEINYLLKRLPKSEVKRDLIRDICFTEDIFKMVGIPVESEELEVKFITGIIRSIFITSMNSNSIGEDVIERVVKFQIESVVNYISSFMINGSV